MALLAKVQNQVSTEASSFGIKRNSVKNQLGNFGELPCYHLKSFALIGNHHLADAISRTTEEFHTACLSVENKSLTAYGLKGGKSALSTLDHAWAVQSGIESHTLTITYREATKDSSVGTIVIDKLDYAILGSGEERRVYFSLGKELVKNFGKVEVKPMTTEEIVYKWITTFLSDAHAVIEAKK